MRKIFGLILVVALLVGAMAIPASATEGNSTSRAQARIQRLIDRLSEPVEFYVLFTDLLARKSIDNFNITSRPDVMVEIGNGCIADDVEEYGNTATVTTTVEVKDVNVVLTTRARRGSVIVETTFIDRCYSETDGQIYDHFSGTLVRFPYVVKILQRILERMAG